MPALATASWETNWMRRSCSLHLLLFSGLSVRSNARFALARSASVTCGGLLIWATSGWHRGHSWTPCSLHQPKAFGLGSRPGLHSTHCDSGTPCSLHQSSFSSLAPLASDENLGTVQPV